MPGIFLYSSEAGFLTESGAHIPSATVAARMHR